MNTQQTSSTTAIPVNESVVRTRIGVLTYLAPGDSLTTHEIIEALSSAAQHCMQAREVEVVIDLADVTRINSSAIESLLEIQDQLVRLGGWLKIVNVNSIVQQILFITRVNEYLKIIHTEDDAEYVRDIQPVRRKESRLGDILIERKLTTPERIEEAISLQKQHSLRMGQILLDKGWVVEADLLSALSEQLSIPYVESLKNLYDRKVIQQLEKETSRRLVMLPLFNVRGVLTLATPDPQAISGFSEIEERTGSRVQPVLASRENILKAINDAYEDDSYTADLITELDDDFEVVKSTVPDDYEAIDELAGGSPIVNLVNSIIQRAVHDGASDIHIEPSRNKSRVRFRIDGVLYEAMRPRSEVHHVLVSRLKVMANLDIAERRLPQDGRIQVHTHGRLVDLRFSSLPGLHGEKVVLRVLDKNQAILDVNKLGMRTPILHSFKSLLERSFGLILVTGPTGSGKTTTLYAALNYLNSLEKNIVTIEDPVEYQLDIINQNDVRANIGLDFAKVLKHVLRQDPDIIMVGEIREKETAKIAVQAALTGHLVLSTLHTNDSIGAITRMIDMGVEPYLLSSAVIGVIAQRLVRTICPACKTEYLASPEILKRYDWESTRLARGRGCPDCYDSGFKGRLCIHELLECDSGLQQLIMSNPNRTQLTDYMKKNSITSLFNDGLDRVRGKLTTLEEISRAINTQ